MLAISNNAIQSAKSCSCLGCATHFRLKTASQSWVETCYGLFENPDDFAKLTNSLLINLMSQYCPIEYKRYLSKLPSDQHSWVETIYGWLENPDDFAKLTISLLINLMSQYGPIEYKCYQSYPVTSIVELRPFMVYLKILMILLSLLTARWSIRWANMTQ